MIVSNMGVVTITEAYTSNVSAHHAIGSTEAGRDRWDTVSSQTHRRP